MDFLDYLTSVQNQIANNPSWRMGQAYFNVLYAIEPELADKIRGDFLLDPFHRDERIPAFLSWLYTAVVPA
jgi:hypothetical protein